MTMVESFRAAFKAIVDAVGNDSFILACNAALWPVLGLCHGQRVTNDIHRDWKHIHTNAEELFWRNWQNNVLWINDPDVIVLEKQSLPSRKPDGTVIMRPSEMTDEEIEFHKAFAVACGGMILSGDLIPTLSEKNIKVLKKMLPPIGISAVFDDFTFRIGRIEKDGNLILTLFNWGEEEQKLEVPLDRKYSISNFWTDEAVGEFADVYYSEVMPPHSGRVLLCCPAK